MKQKIVILANGRFPANEIPLGYLKAADIIVCCDGAVQDLVDYGIEPSVIVGDMDSISAELKQRFSDILNPEHDDQDTNDLTKAIRYSIGQGFADLVILGATGLREDHSLGNISLLSDYSEFVSARMVTDSGVFIPVNSGEKVHSWPGQQVSIFSFTRDILKSSENLKYPIRDLSLQNLWMGTLNECTSDYFSLNFESGRILVFLEF